jgi:8-amino-7-oxononanoate synthase
MAVDPHSDWIAPAARLSMFDSWRDDLRKDLARLAERDLLRTPRICEPLGRLIRREGRTSVNLAGNDYLGLANHPGLRDAAIEATRLWGTGATASRLICGHLPLHAQVEAKFAAFKHAQAALILPTGYTANHAAITALAGPGDLLCLDKLNHASLIDAARASGGEVRVFPHLNYGKLERLLEKGGSDRNDATPLRRRARRFIVTDSVFSMDGDVADLPRLCDLAERFEAILLVDEAHGTGVLGDTGAGLVEHQGLDGRVDVVVSTASKALGGLGGIITADREVIDTIVNRARSFLFSTAPPAGQVAAIGAALDVMAKEPWRRRRLIDLSLDLRGRLGAAGWLSQTQANPGIPTPIIPLVVGSSGEAIRLSAYLEDRGFCAPAIRPPTVAAGTARVRLSLRADLEAAEIDALLDALATWDGPRLEVKSAGLP